MDTNQRKEETKKRVYRYLREGLTKKGAAFCAGISEKTFFRWLQEDTEFATNVEKSIAEYHEFLIKVLNRGAVRSPRIALKILKLRFPDEWDPERVAKYQRSEKKPSEGAKEIAEMLQAMLKEGHAIEDKEKMTVLTATHG